MKQESGDWASNTLAFVSKWYINASAKHSHQSAQKKALIGGLYSTSKKAINNSTHKKTGCEFGIQTLLCTLNVFFVHSIKLMGGGGSVVWALGYWPEDQGFKPQQRQATRQYR